MNSLLLGLLERTLAALLVRLAALDMNQVRDQVLAVWDVAITGEQKRQWVYRRLRELSAQGASWLLYAAIEIAVGQVKREQSQ